MLSRLPKLLRRVLLSVVAFFLFLVIAERLLDSPTILLLWSCLPRQALENRGLGSGKAATPACAGLDRASLLQGGPNRRILVPGLATSPVSCSTIHCSRGRTGSHLELRRRP